MKPSKVTLKDKEKNTPKKDLEIPTFVCGGKLKDFNLDDLDDLPKHKMGKEFSPLDRESIYTGDFSGNR